MGALSFISLFGFVLSSFGATDRPFYCQYDSWVRPAFFRFPIESRKCANMAVNLRS